MRTGLLVVLVSSAVGSVAHGQLYEWVAPVNGDWDEPLNWSLGTVPSDVSSDVLLGFGSAYSVTMSTDTIVGEISISNPNAVLFIDGADLDLGGDLGNNGTLRLVSGAINLVLDRRFDGNGRVELAAVTEPSSVLLNAAGASLINGPGHTIAGSGRVQGVLQNNGTVVADDLGGPGLELDDSVTQGPNGRIGASGGQLLLQNDVSITGGELFTANGGVIRIDGPFNSEGTDATIGQVQINGRIDVLGSFHRLLVDGPVQNNGQIVLNANMDAINTNLIFVSDSSVVGNGEIVLNRSGNFIPYLTGESGVEVIIGPNMTVRGSGIVEGNADLDGGGIINNGLVVADDPDEPLILRGDHFGSGLFGANNAEIGLNNGSRLVGCRLNTQGTGVIAIGGGLTTLVGGVNDGYMFMNSTADMRVEGVWTNNGLFEVNPFAFLTEMIWLREDAEIQGNGTISFGDLSHGFFVSPGECATIGPNQRILGSAGLNGDITMHGILELEGTVDINAHVALSATTVVRAQVSDRGFGFRDEIFVFPGLGQLELAGTLEIEFDPGFVPVAGNSWRIVNGELGTEITGTFETTVLPPMPDGLEMIPVYNTDGLYLVVQEGAEPCPADLTGDGVLNFFDVSAFLNAYNAMDPIADFDNNGVFNFFDVSGFLNAFNAGCP